MNIILNNGKNFPALGFGTWQLKGQECKEAIKHAINVGYRHFDGAWVYMNEEIVGETLNEQINLGKIKREDIFVTSKLWNCFHRPDEVEKGFKESLDKLKMDYIDLYLMHWPIAYTPGFIYVNEDEINKGFDYVDLKETWKAMEQLVISGKVKSIGLSNFNIKQMEYIMSNCTIKPAVLQVELHLYLPNNEVVDYCKSQGIAVTAYSPLGSPGRPWKEEASQEPITDTHVLTISQRRNCSSAQVLISYILNRGLACIPKSSNPARMQQNFESANLKLTDEDMDLLNSVTIRKRYVFPNITKKNKDCPFDVNEFNN